VLGYRFHFIMKPTFSMVINQKERAAKGLLQKLDKTRQTDLITSMGAEAATERQILNRVGDTRYTRELLRKLISMNIVERTGKGGLHDPFRYKLSPFLGAFDFSRVQDPILERRMKRLEEKILDLLSDTDRMLPRSERCIRTVVGDNTGTGKALRRLVKSSKVPPILGTPLIACPLRNKRLNLALSGCAHRKGRRGRPLHVPAERLSPPAPATRALPHLPRRRRRLRAPSVAPPAVARPRRPLRGDGRAHGAAPGAARIALRRERPRGRG
jgi:hypothetical protein